MQLSFQLWILLDLDVVMQMNNLIEYSDNYSETSGNLWQYYRDEPNATLTDSESFKSKMKIATNTPLMVIKRMLK